MQSRCPEGFAILAAPGGRQQQPSPSVVAPRAPPAIPSLSSRQSGGVARGGYQSGVGRSGFQQGQSSQARAYAVSQMPQALNVAEPSVYRGMWRLCIFIV